MERLTGGRSRKDRCGVGVRAEGGEDSRNEAGQIPPGGGGDRGLDFLKYLS